MTTRILFVCLGNICRSPAAEGVFRNLAPMVTTDSAGTGDWHVGDPPFGPMQQATRARGHDISDLRGRQITVQDFDRFDLIVAMDVGNRRDIEAMRPQGNTTPVRLLTHFAPHRQTDDVPDPYYTRDFDGVLDLIEDAVRGLAATL
ncbi:low molecular weight protein-tyrosine-phosphatase [Roseovarius sp. SYSU LYC5161]|jgi:protein-tyrosine phosphatase|uniref:low molecular weight protein-tyrosine-phosphatase n=1 Tax=Roseovarius halophilus (ex Wu et al. 2025) TaxID=3376060 RepID=UPI0028712625|nr:low molecular weight protein-tyrosine-phosphatase [Roseovarius sp.]